MIDTLTCPQKKPEKTLSKIAITVVAGLVLSTMALSAHANLVANGSFETTTLPTPGGKVDNTNVSNWQLSTAVSGGYVFLDYYNKALTNGNLNLYGGQSDFLASRGATPGNFPATSPSGGSFIVSDASLRNASIYQTVSGLIPGKDYKLTFYQAAGQQRGFTGATSDLWRVTLGGTMTYQGLTLLDGNPLYNSYSGTGVPGGGLASVGYQIDGETYLSQQMNVVSTGFVPWMQQTMTFTATATSELLGFLALGSPGGLPPFALLDGITLTIVPEPNRFLLIAVGGLAFAYMYRRGQRRTVVVVRA